jgi:pseudouridine-5'-phosphate glycosidase
VAMNKDTVNSLDLGKLIDRKVGTTTVNATIEATRNAWSLLVIAADGTVGVAAQGPIQSLEVILKILELAGVNPHAAKDVPKFGVVG